MCELMNETNVYSSDLSGSPLLRFVTGAVGQPCNQRFLNRVTLPWTKLDVKAWLPFHSIIQYGTCSKLQGYQITKFESTNCCSLTLNYHWLRGSVLCSTAHMITEYCARNRSLPYKERAWQQDNKNSKGLFCLDSLQWIILGMGNRMNTVDGKHPAPPWRYKTL